MFKTSARRREIVRNSKKKTGVKGDAGYQREYHQKHAHTLNEKRRARRARHGEKTKVPSSDRIERLGNLSIISHASFAKDRTRWTGPAATTEKRLEAEADAFLKEKGWTPELRERIFKKKGPHEQPR